MQRRPHGAAGMSSTEAPGTGAAGVRWPIQMQSATGRWPTGCTRSPSRSVCWRRCAGRTGSARSSSPAAPTSSRPSTSRPFDEQPIVDAVARGPPIDLPGTARRRLARVGWPASIELTARMLAARGTESFLVYNRELYGTPNTPLRYDPITPYELAERVARGPDRARPRRPVVRDAPRPLGARRWPTSSPPGWIAHFGPEDAPASRDRRRALCERPGHGDPHQGAVGGPACRPGPGATAQTTRPSSTC